MAEDYSNGQLLLGDPDEFAQEMIKLINDKEFRLACVNVKSRVVCSFRGSFHKSSGSSALYGLAEGKPSSFMLDV